MSVLYMKTDFWKLRSSEALYILSSRVFVAVMTLHLLSDDSIWLSSAFLFTYFMTKSLAGILLSHRLEAFPKKHLLMILTGFFIFIVLASGLSAPSLGFSSQLVLPVAAGIGFVDSFYASVVNAFIPDVVEKKELDDAFRKTFLMQASVDLFGIALGMTGYTLLGLTTILWIILAGACIVLIIQKRIIHKGHASVIISSDSKSSIVKSLSLFLHYRFEPWWALSSLIINLFLVPFSSFVIPYVIVKVSSESPMFIGMIEGCAASGAIASSFYIQKKAEQSIGKSGVVIVSFFILSLAFLMLSLSTNVLVWSVLAFLMGMAIVMNNVSVEASRSVAIPEEHRVKIQTIHNCIIGLGNPFGLLIVPYIVSKYSYSTALLLSCVSVFLVAVFVKFIPQFNVLLANDSDVSNLYKHTYGDQ